MSVNTPHAPQEPLLTDAYTVADATDRADVAMAENYGELHHAFAVFLKSSSGKRAKTLLRKSKSTYAHSLPLFQIYRTVFDSVTASIPGMWPGHNYTAEQLCGADVWGAWKGNAAGIAAGMSLAHLVRRKVVPLEPHSTLPSSGSRKYKALSAIGELALLESKSMKGIEFPVFVPLSGGIRSGVPLVHGLTNPTRKGA